MVWHYLKLVLAIAAIGTLIGVVGGNWLGRALTRLYGEFYSFPFLIFRESPGVYLIAAGISFAAAMLGALRAVSTAFALPAAVAMQPPAPPLYRARCSEGAGTRAEVLSQLTIMALRHIVGHRSARPHRRSASSFSVALLVVSMFFGRCYRLHDRRGLLPHRAAGRDLYFDQDTPGGPRVPYGNCPA